MSRSRTYLCNNHRRNENLMKNRPSFASSIVLWPVYKYQEPTKHRRENQIISQGKSSTHGNFVSVTVTERYQQEVRIRTTSQQEPLMDMQARVQQHTERRLQSRRRYEMAMDLQVPFAVNIESRVRLTSSKGHIALK